MPERATWDTGSTDGFRQLMQDVAAGSSVAAQQLLTLHGDQIYRVIRRRLNRMLRRRFDSDDFAQAVWESMFRNRELFGRFGSADELVAFLRTVAANKVVDECRRLLESQRRDLRKERSPEECGVASFDNLPSADPTPSATLYAQEELERLPAHLRRMLSLRVAGATYEEIANELGVAESTVRRTFKKLAHDHTERDTKRA
jgi:RNA polymerase sigma factor (sigma-70 family)